MRNKKFFFISLLLAFIIWKTIFPKKIACNEIPRIHIYKYINVWIVEAIAINIKRNHINSFFCRNFKAFSHCMLRGYWITPEKRSEKILFFISILIESPHHKLYIQVIIFIFFKRVSGGRHKRWLRFDVKKKMLK